MANAETLQRQVENLQWCLWRCAEAVGANVGDLRGPGSEGFAAPSIVRLVREKVATTEQGGR